MSKYWNNQGTFQSEFDALTQELMPAMGEAESLAGELVRAANRLYYDAFNNGFCNNTSGAVNFLYTYLVPFYKDDRDLKEALDLIAPKTNTGGYSSTGAMTGAALDTIVDKVAQLIINQPELKVQPNPCDLFDLQDDDYYEPEDDYEEEEEYDDEEF